MIQEKVRQVKLEPNELAFLLHTHGATQVTGLDDDYFFPEDTAVLQESLAAGLDSLKQNGWLQPDKNGQGFNTNASMMLLTAVLAAPQKLLIMQRMINDEHFQIFTYSWAQEYLVEQYRTADGSYILTDLQQNEAVIDRLIAAFDIPTDTSRHDSVEVTLETFQTILATSPEQRLQAWLDVLPIEKHSFASELATLKRAGILALSQQINPQLLPQEIALLHDESGNCWSMEARPNQIKLQKVDKERLVEQLKL